MIFAFAATVLDVRTHNHFKPTETFSTRTFLCVAHLEKRGPNSSHELYYNSFKTLCEDTSKHTFLTEGTLRILSRKLSRSAF